jgi:ribosome-associated protein
MACLFLQDMTTLSVPSKGSPRSAIVPPDTDIQITETVTIPSTELRFQFSRSGGPGGQHVNRTASQVELTFDVLSSPSLDETQRARVLSKLKSYIDTRGILHLTSQTTRSQHRNRTEVVERFTLLLQRALHVPKRRIPTRPSAAAEARRLAEKQRTRVIKQQRRRPEPATEE